MLHISWLKIDFRFEEMSPKIGLCSNLYIQAQAQAQPQPLPQLLRHNNPIVGNLTRGLAGAWDWTW